MQISKTGPAEIEADVPPAGMRTCHLIFFSISEFSYSSSGGKWIDGLYVVNYSHPLQLVALEGKRSSTSRRVAIMRVFR